MKQLTFGIILVLALAACSDSVYTKTRRLDFNCDNDFKVSFTESTTIKNNTDTTNKVTVDVISPMLKREFSMKQVRAASGVKYATKDGKYIFWEHQGEFTFGTEDSTYCLCK